MSKIHQAIRRAEREGKRVIPSRAAAPRDVLLEIKQQIARVPEAPVEDDREIILQNLLGPREAAAVEMQQLSTNPRLVAASFPRSYASEQYRTLKTKLYQMRESSKLKTILVTSAVPAEGKTLTSVNLALTIAQEINQRVLLIDADLRKPSVHRTLELPQRTGLAEMLREELPADSVIAPSPFENLFLVQSGSVPENPAELLNTQGMRDFLTRVSEGFDWVILDSPPLLQLADAELLSTMVDGILLVVRAFHTPADYVRKSARSLQGKKVLGIVFNGNEAPKHSKYYYYGYRSREADRP